MSPDFRDLLSTFNVHSVEYIVVGAHALAAHGHVRATKDLDIWVRPSRGRYLLAFLLCTVLVVVSVAWVDRPVAEYAFTHFRDTALAHWTLRVLESLRFILPLAILWLVGSASWQLSARPARPVPSWARTPLAVSVSVGLAGPTTILLKYFFGRTSADPSFVVQRVYEWRPLRGDASHLAFPSGAMAMAGAALTVLCIVHPRLRVASAVVLVALAVALIVTNSHWVADVIAGVFLGIGVGSTAPRWPILGKETPGG